MELWPIRASEHFHFQIIPSPVTLSIPFWKGETILTAYDNVAFLGAVIGGEKALMTVKAHCVLVQNCYH